MGRTPTNCEGFRAILKVITMDADAAMIGQGGIEEVKVARQGAALALSGGGFRATLFHCGSLRRLNELGILSKLTTISSVSGGSIANGLLTLKWPKFQPDAKGVFTNFEKEYCEPIREFCQKDLRTQVLVWDRANPRNWFRLASRDYSITDRLCAAYAAGLGMDVPLRSLVAQPKFLFLASNLETGASWRFECGPGAVMGDYYSGFAPVGDTPLATAVGASSAFPVAFPPLILQFDPKVFARPHPQRHQTDESKMRIALTDGGVYDNMGLEPIWLRHRHILVSDAGRPFTFDGDPGLSLKARLARVFDVSSNQVEAVRKRWLIDTFVRNKEEVSGAYWGIGSDVANYKLDDSPGFHGDAVDFFRAVRTDLDEFTDEEVASLENHGYALANVAVQKWTKNLIGFSADFKWPFAGFTSDDDVKRALASSAERGIIGDVWESLKEHTIN
jgi:NTE family protein